MAAACAAAVACAAAFSGCESTFEQSARLAKQGGASQHEQGLSIGTDNPDVRVTDTATITDPNGTAVVITLKSTAKETQVDVPIAIDVLGAKQQSVFKNDTPGLEPSLTAMSVVPPGESDWVNDQIQPTEPAKSVKATVGLPKAKAPAQLPKLDVGAAKIQNDPSSGLLAIGQVKNDSTVLQKKLVIYGVTRDGKKVTAAGRAVLPALKPGKSGTYRIYFIGDPRKGKLTVTAPPTTFE